MPRFHIRPTNIYHESSFIFFLPWDLYMWCSRMLWERDLINIIFIVTDVSRGVEPKAYNIRGQNCYLLIVIEMVIWPQTIFQFYFIMLMMGLMKIDHGRGNEKWRDPLSEEKLNQCLHYLRGHLDHSMPSITPWTVMKLTV